MCTTVVVYPGAATCPGPSPYSKRARAAATSAVPGAAPSAPVVSVTVEAAGGNVSPSFVNVTQSRSRAHATIASLELRAGERSTSVPAGASTTISTPVPNAGATAETLTVLPQTPGEAALADSPAAPPSCPVAATAPAPAARAT